MKRKTLVFAVILGICFDILFWKQQGGISFFLFISLLIGFASFLLQDFKNKEIKRGLLFLIPIVFFSIMSFVRAEPFTSFLNRFVVLLLISIWAIGYQNGMWLKFGLIDFLSRGLGLVWRMISLPMLRFDQFDFFKTDEKEKNKKVKPLIRGFLISLPILIIFTLLFASADLVFSSVLKNVLDAINIDNLGEILARFLLLFFISNLFIGLIVYSSTQSKDINLIGEKKPFVSKFLGFTEAKIVISTVLLLFATFILVQFKYLFFSESAIADLGFTYSEYARRGFGELIAVSILSLGLILILNATTNRDGKKQKRTFSALVTGLVVGNIFVLISSYQRLHLYEIAFGFSRLRTYSHIFLVWLGILLISTAVLEWKQKARMITNICIACLIGFTATMNLLNIDAFIVRQNIGRFNQDHELDYAYLASLSTDAIPALTNNLKYFSNSDLTGKIEAALVCHLQLNDDFLQESSWQAFNISRARAAGEFENITYVIDSYEIRDDEWPIQIINSAGSISECGYTFSF